MYFFFRFICHFPGKDLMGSYYVAGTVLDAEAKLIKPATVLPLPKRTFKQEVNPQDEIQANEHKSPILSLPEFAVVYLFITGVINYPNCSQAGPTKTEYMNLESVYMMVGDRGRHGQESENLQLSSIP